MHYTKSINTVTYINKDNKIIKLEKDCPICNNIFNLDDYGEDIYEEQDGEDIL